LDTTVTAQDPKSGPGPLPEIVREIRVHGNSAIADAGVLKIAGLSLDAPLPPDGVSAIEKRLKGSGWFETIEVRKRYRSLSDPSDVAIVLLVHEKATVTASPATGVPQKRMSRWFTSRLMFLPILSYADGYGFTYGARFSTKDLLGMDERLSVPLTWGGTRRAAVELERTFRSGPFTRLFTSAAIYQRENPRFEIDDRRIELRGRAERNFAHILYAGAEASRSSVKFADLDDRMWTAGADLALDTRGDPSFPGNAVYLFGGWTALNVDRLDRINRYTADARGYLRLFGQPVLAGRALYRKADATLPPYERLLIGGSSSLRGFRTGEFDGDKTLSTSGELRIPITSVISGGKFGVTVFADAAKAVNFNEKLSDAKWQRGAGAGVFLIASVVRLNFDVSHGFDGGGTRVHLSSGFAF
jgi:outer membrane protein assembly factor BamA